MMMLKFGRVVNLDALEGLTTNKMIGELEQTLKEAERKYERAKCKLEVSFVLFIYCHYGGYTCTGILIKYHVL